MAVSLHKNYPHLLLELDGDDIWKISRFDGPDGRGEDVPEAEADVLLSHGRFWLYVWDVRRQHYVMAARPTLAFDTWMGLIPHAQPAQRHVVAATDTLKAITKKWHSLMDAARLNAYQEIYPDLEVWGHLLGTYIHAETGLDVKVAKAEGVEFQHVFATVTLTFPAQTDLEIILYFSHKPALDAWWVDVLVQMGGKTAFTVDQATDAKYTALDVAGELQSRNLMNKTASEMNFETFWKWLDDLRVGDEVMMYWTAGSGGHYRGKARLVKVNAKSVVGELTEEVAALGGTPYPIGHKITVPRDIINRQHREFFNSPMPIGVDKVTRPLRHPLAHKVAARYLRAIYEVSRGR